MTQSTTSTTTTITTAEPLSSKNEHCGVAYDANTPIWPDPATNTYPSSGYLFADTTTKNEFAAFESENEPDRLAMPPQDVALRSALIVTLGTPTE